MGGGILHVRAVVAVAASPNSGTVGAVLAESVLVVAAVEVAAVVAVEVGPAEDAEVELAADAEVGPDACAAFVASADVDRVVVTVAVVLEVAVVDMTAVSKLARLVAFVNIANALEEIGYWDFV